MAGISNKRFRFLLVRKPAKWHFSVNFLVNFKRSNVLPSSSWQNLDTSHSKNFSSKNGDEVSAVTVQNLTGVV